MDDIKLPKQSQSDFDEIQNPLELDLVAVFSVIQDSVFEIFDKNITPEEMIKEVEELLDGKEKKV